MYGGGSRRIEGRGTIQRPGDNEYINTSYLPPEKTIQAVRYYNRRKQELKTNPSDRLNSDISNRGLSGANLENQIKSMMKSNRQNNTHVSNHIKEVKVEPIIVDNNTCSFDEKMYPLNQEDKVDVLEQRYFPLQNYYNFVYEMELKKEMNRFINETEAKVLEAVHDQMPDKPKTDENQSMKQKSQHYIEEKINGKTVINQKDGRQNNNYSKIGKSKAASSLPANELVPVHIQYNGQSYQKNLIFTVNENKRLQLSRRR